MGTTKELALPTPILLFLPTPKVLILSFLFTNYLWTVVLFLFNISFLDTYHCCCYQHQMSSSLPPVLPTLAFSKVLLGERAWGKAGWVADHPP